MIKAVIHSKTKGELRSVELPEDMHKLCDAYMQLGCHSLVINQDETLIFGRDNEIMDCRS